MKINSKVLGILTVLFAVAVIVSAAGAADLVNDFKNDNFAISVPSASNFTEGAATSVNIGDVAMKMLVFENSGNNSNDIGTIIYLKDSSANRSVISDFSNDLKKDNEVVEENANYTVVKTKSSEDFNFFNFENAEKDIDRIMSGVGDIFSSNGDINFSADGNSISLSDKGLQITDANGEGVSITSEGINVSDSANNVSGNASFNIDGNFTNDIQNSEYVVYVENSDKTQSIAVSGNNVDVLKAMAGTVSFK